MTDGTPNYDRRCGGSQEDHPGTGREGIQGALLARGHVEAEAVLVPSPDLAHPCADLGSHQVDDGPVTKTSVTVADFHQERIRALEAEARIVALAAECDRYRAALERIRDMDYRGNRSTESAIAYRALGECKSHSEKEKL